LRLPRAMGEVLRDAGHFSAVGRRSQGGFRHGLLGFNNWAAVRKCLERANDKMRQSLSQMVQTA
jgi:hypothetical protein